MKKILLLVFAWNFVAMFSTLGQTTVQINGPSSAPVNSQILFNVSFHSGGYQIAPPTNGTYHWDYTGAMLVYQSDLELRLNFTATGQQMVYYEYNTYSDYYYDYHYVDVSGYTCDNVIPTAGDVSREGEGTVTLSAGTAPSDSPMFGMTPTKPQWYQLLRISLRLPLPLQKRTIWDINVSQRDVSLPWCPSMF